MSAREDYAAAVVALAAPVNAEFLAEATVDTEPRRAKTTVSGRIKHELTEPLFAEAERCGITPSQLVAEFVEEGLARRRELGTQPVVVAPADLHRALDMVLNRAA